MNVLFYVTISYIGLYLEGLYFIYFYFNNNLSSNFNTICTVM